MDDKIAQEILDVLFSSLEAMESQSTAVLQFLKAKDLATDEELAPHIQQAENAASVRWRAARVRINYLLAGAMKQAEKSEANEEHKPAKKPAEDSSSEENKGDDTTSRQDDKKPNPEPKPKEELGASSPEVKNNQQKGDKEGDERAGAA
jgi:hypothetical protein